MFCFVKKTLQNELFMIITIVLILSVLVALNFALLAFSCNKYPKERSNIRSTRVKANDKQLKKDNQNTTELLPTGS